MTTKTNEIKAVAPEITNQPVGLSWNMDDVKNYLKAITEKYQNLVVTDENVEESKKTLREIVSLRTGLKRFEKKGKDLLNAPVRQFKSQCEELAIIIEDVEKPLRQQLDLYEQERLEKLQEKIDKEIESKAMSAGLTADELAMFNSDQRWYNKTAKWSEICIGIDREIARLSDIKKANEEAARIKAERLDIIRQYVVLANMQYQLQTPVAETIAEHFGDDESLGDIKDAIFNLAKERGEIERKAAEAAKPEPVPETIPEPDPEQPEPEEQPVYQIPEQPALEHKEERFNLKIVFEGVTGKEVSEIQEKLDRYGFKYDVIGVEEYE